MTCTLFLLICCISLEMYEDFIFPYNNDILIYYNGGAIHACGKVYHFVPLLLRMTHLYGFNMFQPEYNNMEKVFTYTLYNGIPIIGFSEDTIFEFHSSGRDLKGLVSIG